MVGNSVHDSAEEYLKNHDVNLSKEDIEDKLVEIESNFDYNYDDRNKVENCLSFLAKFISGYVDSVNTVEEKMTMVQNGIDFTGYADLIGDVEGVNTVVDWKTGKENPEWKERIQGGMYVKMFHEEYGEWPDSIQFVYLDEGTRSVHNRVDNGEIMWNDYQNEYWDDIKGYISNMTNDAFKGEFEAKPEDSKCYWCDFAMACEDGGRGAETAEPQHYQIEGVI
jgi:RecB family exonuclease